MTKEHKIQWVLRMHLFFVFYCLVWIWCELHVFHGLLFFFQLSVASFLI